MNPSRSIILQHCPLLVEPAHSCIYTCALDRSGAVTHAPLSHPHRYTCRSEASPCRYHAVEHTTCWLLDLCLTAMLFFSFFPPSFFTLTTNEQKSQSWYNVSHRLFLLPMSYCLVYTVRIYSVDEKFIFVSLYIFFFFLNFGSRSGVFPVSAFVQFQFYCRISAISKTKLWQFLLNNTLINKYKL